MTRLNETTVDDYLRALPADRRAALERLRSMALRLLPGFEERIEYGMLYYRKDGAPGVGLASQRGHVALYVGSQVLGAHQQELKSLDVGKGCIRFPKVGEIDFGLVESLIRTAAH